MKGYVPIFFDWLEVTEELNATEKGRLIDAIVAYARGGDWQEFAKGNERYLFPAFRGQIDRANEISEVRSRATDNRRNQKASNEIKTDQNESNINKNANNNNNKYNNKEDNNNKNDKKSNMRFAPPTREELTAYIAEKGYKVDADRWLAYYESNGWKVGRNPMKDWKAAVRTWASNGFDKPAKPAAKVVSGQDYQQRDYSGKKAEMPDWMIAGMKELENVEV